MDYKGRRQSSNVQDRRAGGGAASIGGVGLVIILIYSLLTNDLSLLFNVGLNQLATKNVNTEFVETEHEKEMAEYVSVVLADTEDVWHEIFEKHNMRYEEPTMILFKGQVQSACGNATSAVGPFYCPADQSIYIDLDFHYDLKSTFGTTGDFAMAYVIAHEVGHHIQTLLGVSEEVNQYRRKLPTKEFNQILKRQELQADYYAGVWAHHMKKSDLLDINDIDEALDAASAIGDDKIQEMSQGEVTPDNFTHGTSKQRVRWLKNGYQYGDFKHGNTFDLNENEL